MRTGLKAEITEAKNTLKKLKKLYPEIPTFPLAFQKLMPKGLGFIKTSWIKGLKKKTIKILIMVIDNSGDASYELGYIVCHEFAHAILIFKNADTRESKKHENLTYVLAKKMNFCS